MKTSNGLRPSDACKCEKQDRDKILNRAKVLNIRTAGLWGSSEVYAVYNNSFGELIAIVPYSICAPHFISLDEFMQRMEATGTDRIANS